MANKSNFKNLLLLENKKTIKPFLVFKIKSEIKLLYSVLGNKKLILSLVSSPTGVNFDRTQKNITLLQANGKAENLKKCSDFRIFTLKNVYLFTYLRNFKVSKKFIIASSRDLLTWKELKAPLYFKSRLFVIDNYQFQKKFAGYFGENFIQIAYSKNLKTWEAQKDFLISARQGFFDQAGLKILDVLTLKQGLLMFYNSTYKKNGLFHFQIGGALFSKKEPDKVIWRSDVPVWDEYISEKEAGLNPQFLGSFFQGNKFFLYWLFRDQEIRRVVLRLPFLIKVNNKIFKLKKYHNNPILSPFSDHEWENEAVFNPTAYYDGQKVHLVYRAVGSGAVSTLGYASSKDGYNIDKRESKPIYQPRERFEGLMAKPEQINNLYVSGGVANGYNVFGGCEDPKLTCIEEEGKIYLTYVAYDGFNPPRVAISSISKADFLAKKWQWKKACLMSRPGVIDKSACLLPEKINGCYVMFHRVFPHILVDYLEDLEFSSEKWLKNERKISPRAAHWDSRKLSVGAAPIKIDQGWLVIYHAVDDRDDQRYKIGAMILDYNDPTKILYRTNNPILEPEERYENEGKFGIAYPCGAAIIKKHLFVYYGGGDRVVCVATAPLKEFIQFLTKEENQNSFLEKINF